MSISTSRPPKKTDLYQKNQPWSSQQISPERTKIWTEPSNTKPMIKKVPVVYYLSRNGQLEHPHFMEVPISSSEKGLYLRDVIERLNVVRGKGMAGMYSWSCKRSYRNNGYVWHDLSEGDFVYPAHGSEYVLKGSELPESVLGEVKERRSEVAAAVAVVEDSRRRRNQSCSSIDFGSLQEYSVYKAEASGISAAADASTQTDDRRRRRRPPPEIVEEDKKSSELQRDEIEMGISPPPSDSSPETLETLLKADGRLILRHETDGVDQKSNVHNNNHIGSKSSILMKLITCGSISFKDCGAVQGMGLMSQYKMRLPRGNGGVKLEDKEYFSGSIVETKKEEELLHPAVLKRSTSYNADRSSKLELEDREIEGVRTKCIPRKPKSSHSSTKKEGMSHNLSCSRSSTVNDTCT